MSNNNPQYLLIPNGKLAYHKISGKTPGILYCGGFRSDMTGTKVLAVEEYCRKKGLSFVRFDYRGHGQSSGNFADYVLSDWRDDGLAVLDQLTTGPQIIVGSSMGSWIGLLLALARLDRVTGFVGVASAPDFTEELIWQQLSVQQQLELKTKGVLYYPATDTTEEYPISYRFIEDGRKHLLLQQTIPLNIPVNLLHGCEDRDVSWNYSLRLLQHLQSNNVCLKLIKDGTHRLMREQDLEALLRAIDELLISIGYTK